MFIFLLATTIVAVGATNDLVTNFHRQAQLSPDELEQVVALALECGIGTVGNVSTYNIHPSSTFGVSVISREEVNGRYAYYKVMGVVNPVWKPKSTPPPNAKRRGKFWVNHMPRAVTNVICELKGTKFRIRHLRGISISQCDAVLLALSADRIEMATNLDSAKQALVRAVPKLWQPGELVWREQAKEYFASYTIGKYLWRCIRFRIVDGVVRIHDVSDSAA